MVNQEDTLRFKSTLYKWGADLVGVADTEPLKDLSLNPPDLLEGFSRAVAVAVQIPIGVFETITDRPTPIYNSVCLTANRILDELAFKTSLLLQADGYRSLPVPASQVLDRENWYGAISHKAVARMAGLGWQGKNLLLITPQFGPRVRLVTILTDAPLSVDPIQKNRCGKCRRCLDACPARAIKGVNTEDHYKDREEALHFERCVERLNLFKNLPEIGTSICGICIKACPFGRRLKKMVPAK